MDVQKIRAVLDYCPETGKLTWRVRDPSKFKYPKMATSWNMRYSGKEAFTSTTPLGYRQGHVFGVPLLAHRLAIAIHTGSFPDLEVDHINGDPSDNRIVNLRSCGKARNQRNRKANKNNTSGFSGVNWRESHGKWRAAFRHNGKEKHVGYFIDPSEAYDALVVARAKYGFTDRHGK